MGRDWYEKLERQAEKCNRDELDRLSKLTDEFIRTAKPGELFTFKFGTMDLFVTELRKDFDDYNDRFSIDPTFAMVYLGKNKQRWKGGPWSISFIGTSTFGDAAIVWLDSEQITNLCAYKTPERNS